MRRQHTDIADLRQPAEDVLGDIARHQCGLRVGGGAEDCHGDGWRPAWENAGSERRCSDGEPCDDTEFRHRGREAKLEHRLSRRSCFRRTIVFKFRLNRRSGWLMRDLGLKQITAPGDEPDQQMIVVVKRCANSANALVQAVFADMDVRPDRLHKLLFAHSVSGIGQENAQHGEWLWPEPRHLAVRRAKLGALLVQFEAGKPQRCLLSSILG